MDIRKAEYTYYTLMSIEGGIIMSRKIFKSLLTVILLIAVVYVSFSIYLSVKVNEFLNDFSSHHRLTKEYNDFINEKDYNTVFDFISVGDENVVNVEIKKFTHSIPLTIWNGLTAIVSYRYCAYTNQLLDNGENIINNCIDYEVELNLELVNGKWRVVSVNNDNV